MSTIFLAISTFEYHLIGIFFEKEGFQYCSIFVVHKIACNLPQGGFYD